MQEAMPRVKLLGPQMHEHLEELRRENPFRVFIVRGLNQLGFASEACLLAHFSQFGPVKSVLVAHPHVQSKAHDSSRIRPGRMGFVVMASAASVGNILAHGPRQLVAGCWMRVQRFEQLAEPVRGDDATHLHREAPASAAAVEAGGRATGAAVPPPPGLELAEVEGESHAGRTAATVAPWEGGARFPSTFPSTSSSGFATPSSQSRSTSVGSEGAQPSSFASSAEEARRSATAPARQPSELAGATTHHHCLHRGASW